MKIYVSKNYSAYANLPLEELIVSDPQETEDILLLYQNENAVIIGRNQNAHQEIKRDYINENKIELARRMSGGGAVYHDRGNVNFAFITDKENNSGYELFLTPIIGYLRSLGLDAQFKGRNDLLCNGAKISGNAQFIKGNRISSHGTLLFDVDLTKLSNALNPSKLKMESKGIQSARQRVTNIAHELNYSINAQQFIDGLVKYFVEHFGAKLEEIPFDKYQKDLDQLVKLRSSEEWIYGKNPKFHAEAAKKFDNGILSVKLNVSENKIDDILFEGDFLSLKEMTDVIHMFKGIEFKREKFAQVLDKIDLNIYFGGIKKEEILDLIFE
ncbi:MULTISPECIES: lipoate--protein ligase [unclassified Mycoplasma]|uniref:lipoate--protein ligase n=1 Tax=unclassified Mycoplasma TaxID=2683645 RepID=UPI00211BF82D|nr:MULTISPECIES: lipoate--protein ligase [unclassified Mycoplasma]UUM19912.1 lipoate--protein ligase [Mycoplasma sp. 1578d]UUM24892.1 lipoate--protein ligase [Mycoplasma sp. 3686d]